MSLTDACLVGLLRHSTSGKVWCEKNIGSQSLVGLGISELNVWRNSGSRRGLSSLTVNKNYGRRLLALSNAERNKSRAATFNRYGLQNNFFRSFRIKPALASNDTGSQQPRPTSSLSITDASFWKSSSAWRRARINTLRCLVGCTIGDFSMMWFLQSSYPSLSLGLVMGASSMLPFPLEELNQLLR